MAQITQSATQEAVTNPTTKADNLSKRLIQKDAGTSSVGQTTNGSAIQYKGGNVAQTKGLTAGQKAALSRIGRAAKKTLDTFTNGIPDTETSDAVKMKRFYAQKVHDAISNK